MDMNAAAFRLYVEQELGAEYARFVCEELAFVIPMSFAFVQKSMIFEPTSTDVRENLSDQSRARFFYCDKVTQLEGKTFRY